MKEVPSPEAGGIAPILPKVIHCNDCCKGWEAHDWGASAYGGPHRNVSIHGLSVRNRETENLKI
jgi:hypothetical protein